MGGFLVYSGTNRGIKARASSEYLTIKHRGQDTTVRYDLKNDGWMGYHRLKIVDQTTKGNQPFVFNYLYLVCNGEIYNHQQLRMQFRVFPYQSQSDNELILPLYINKGIENTAKELDGEFAFVLYDQRKECYIAARDPLGIRPLFYGYAKDGSICFASEIKALHAICQELRVFPPGHYYDGSDFIAYTNTQITEPETAPTEEEVTTNIRSLLKAAVQKRFADGQSIGCLLSGGLDSSLIAALAQKESPSPIKTFTIGLDKGSADLEYARLLAKHIGSDHSEIIFTKEDGLAILSELIYMLETFDVENIRAAIGLYILCEHIQADFNIKALLSGDFANELFGYCTNPNRSTESLQQQQLSRIGQAHFYNLWRADRCLAKSGLELRLPYGDLALKTYVSELPPSLKFNHNQQEKHLLRKSFEQQQLIPQEIFDRKKSPSSLSVGAAMAEFIQSFAERKYSDQDLKDGAAKYPHCPPTTKEALMYRKIFESYFPGRATLIPAYWKEDHQLEAAR